MALPADSPLSEVLVDAYKRWTSVKRNAQNWSAQAQSPVLASTLIGWLRMTQAQLGHLNTAASRPGIGTYATDQWGGAYSIGPDFTTMTAAMQGVIDEIVLLAPTVTEDEAGKTDPTFSAAQMADLRTALDALAATIE